MPRVRSSRIVEPRLPAKTIATFLAGPFEGRGSRVALRNFESGRWTTVGGAELGRSVGELAAGLNELGVELGGRVGVVAPTSPGALVVELAVQSIGAATIPIDPALRSAQLARLLHRTQPRQIFVSDLMQLDRVLELRPDLPSLELVLLLMSAHDGEVAAAMHVDRVRARGAERLRAAPALLDELRSRVTPETPAAILPSETSGESSDFVPTHGRLVAAAETLGGVFPIGSGDSVLAAVPGARASYRTLRLLCLSRGAEFVFARTEEGSVGVDLLETQPTVLLAESLWIERLAASALSALDERPAPLRGLYERGLDLGGGRSLSQLAGDSSPATSWKLRVADAMLLSPFRRRRFGARLRRIVSLGAPLADETRRLYAALGIAVLEGEDCSAASGVLALNTPVAFRRGTLGQLLPGIEGRSEGAELLVRGPSGGEWLPSGRRLEVDPEGWVVPSNRSA